MTKRKPTAESLRRKCDTLFREQIRARDRVCQGGPLEHDGADCWGELQCAHWHPRRHLSVRWDPDNAGLMCELAHRYIDTHGDVKWAFVERRLGFDRLLELRRKRDLPWPGRTGYIEVVTQLYGSGAR